MSDRFAVVPAAYVLFLRNGEAGREILLQLRRGTGYLDEHWATAAAGHVEHGESVLEAAAREAHEELGLEHVALEPLCAMHRTGRGAPIDERVDFFFRATTWTGEPRIIEPDKCAELRWFPLDELPAPVVPHELHVIETLHGGTLPAVVTFGF